MSLYLSAQQIQILTAHASRTYPEECCGLLLGLDHPHKQVLEIWETVNAWNPEVGAELGAILPRSATGKRDRFWIDPQDLLNAQRYARDRQMKIIGIYHSHPDHPAVPSESDRLLAWSAYSYVILSVEAGIVVDYRSWTLDEQQQFHAEAILVQPPDG
jgi:proteasome lid subunit RPN8/RPN11